jgi:hypothetical protein
MSYENPDQVPVEQEVSNNAIIYSNTISNIGELDTELNKIGLKLSQTKLYKNEYCAGGDNRTCDCPHWFQVKIENLFHRHYEPNFWVFVCQRKNVKELRFYTIIGDERNNFVKDDFWINTKTDRTQGNGYIHSHSSEQAAQDIKIAHQAAEIEDYKSEKFKKYYEKLFRKKEEK